MELSSSSMSLPWGACCVDFGYVVWFEEIVSVVPDIGMLGRPSVGTKAVAPHERSLTQ